MRRLWRREGGKGRRKGNLKKKKIGLDKGMKQTLWPCKTKQERDRETERDSNGKKHPITWIAAAAKRGGTILTDKSRYEV